MGLVLLKTEWERVKTILESREEIKEGSTLKIFMNNVGRDGFPKL